MTVSSASGRLSIANIRKEDEGSYTCTATNKAGKLEASAFLTVTVKPSVGPIEDRTALEDDPSVSFTCTIRGDPKPHVTWNKRGLKRLLTEVDNIKVSEEKKSVDDTTVTISVLTIFNPEPSDAGVYECVAVNKAGRHSNSAQLIVEFGPNFESQEMDVQWSWDQKPVSLSCVGKTPEKWQ